MNAVKTTLFSALAIIATFGASAAPFPVPQQPLDFVVLRNGETIGSHVITFDTKGATTTVEIQTDIVVKVVMIPVYRFEHKGHEMWKDGHLLALSSTTNDDGTPLKLQVVASEGGLNIVSTAARGIVPAGSIPGSLWTQAAMTQTHLLNSLNGKLMNVSVADLGEVSLKIHNQPIQTHHFAVDGELKREVWYDTRGALVQMRFKGKDDSDILYVLR